MFVLAIWIAVAAGGNLSFAFSEKELSAGEQVLAFFTVISLTITYFSALLLNLCDFPRFAPSRRAVRLGNLLGLPLNFIAFAVTFAVATLGINVVANFVSAAYDLSNLASKFVDFRRVGLVAAGLALLVMPWNLYGSPIAINYFLGALGAFLGPLFGILMVDYWLIRRERVAIAELYKLNGDYACHKSFNMRAVGAFAVTAVPTALLALVVAAATDG